MKNSFRKKELWHSSLKEFDERIKQIKNYNRTMKDMVQNVRKDLFNEISATQNPPNCEDAKYLFVENDKNDFGFGAQLHHFIYATIVGYASGRVVIIEKDKFRYATEMRNGVVLVTLQSNVFSLLWEIVLLILRMKRVMKLPCGFLEMKIIMRKFLD